MTVAMDTNHTHNGTAATNDSSVAAGSAPCDFIFPHQYQKSLIPSLYCIIFVLGFLGNTLVVCVLCRDAARRTVANVYLVNLALSDLLFLAGLPFWVVYYAQDYNWLFGKFMCKLCGSLLSFNIYASIYFLTCMSVDRYRAIVYPLRSQSSRSVCHARLISAFIWVMAAISSLPAVILRDTLYLPELHVTACVIHCSHPNCNAALALTKNILAFLLPFFVIATCYGCIARHLLAMPNQLEMDRGSAHLDRVLRVVVAVVMAFFLCWFPFHLLTLVQALGRLGVEMACWVEQVVETLLPFSLCLGFSNSAINPFLYCFVGNHFREQLRRLYEEKAAPRLSQKRDSFSTRLSSFSRKLSDLREPSLPEALPQPRDP